VLLPALAVVDVALVAALRASDRLPSLPASTAAALVAALVATSLAGLALGLAASALVTDASQATLALPMLCFPQVLFAGAVVPIDDLPAPLRWGSTLLATRWGFEALGRLLRDASIGAMGAARQLPAAFSGGVAGPVVALVLGTVGACAVAARRLRS
jgi:hypothetical protein